MSSLASLPVEIQLDILEQFYEDNMFVHDDQEFAQITDPNYEYWSEEEEEEEASAEGATQDENNATDDTETSISNPHSSSYPAWSVSPTEEHMSAIWKLTGVDPNNPPNSSTEETSRSDIRGHIPPDLASTIAHTEDSPAPEDEGPEVTSKEQDIDWSKENPLKSIGLTSKHFREISKPFLFRTLPLYRRRQPISLNTVIVRHIVPNRLHIRNVIIALDAEIHSWNKKTRDVCKDWYDAYLSVALDRKLLPNVHSLKIIYARSYPIPRTLNAIMDRVQHGDLVRLGVYSKYVIGRNFNPSFGFDVFTNSPALTLLHNIAGHKTAAKTLKLLEVHTDALLPVTYDRIRQNLTSLRKLSFRRCLWIDQPRIILTGSPFIVNGPDGLSSLFLHPTHLTFPRIAAPNEQPKWAPNHNLTTLTFYDCQVVHSGMVLWLVEHFPGLKEVSIATCGHDSDLQIPGPPVPKERGESGQTDTYDNDLSQNPSFLQGSIPLSKPSWAPPNHQVFFPSSPYGSHQPRKPLDVLRVEHACLWELWALSHVPTKELYVTNVAEKILIQVFQCGLDANITESTADDAKEPHSIDFDSDLPSLFPHLQTLHVPPARRGIPRTDQEESEITSVIEWVDIDGTILERACKRRGIEVKRDAVRWRECLCHQEDYL